MTAEAMEVLSALRIDDGRKWGAAATPWQKADAAAVLTPGTATPYHWLGRPRGGAKTSDIGGAGVALLLTQAPPGARLYCVASDADQGALLLDAIRGYVLRAGDVLRERLKVESRRVVHVQSGASLTVVPADEPGAYGLKPWALFCDELAVWPERSQRLWTALVSALTKVPGARMAVLTNAGDPAHWSYRVREQALESPRWRVSEIPGPLPWIPADVLGEQRRLLLPSAYARLHENRWVASEDRLTTPEQVAACVGHRGDLEPVPGQRYVLGLDVGLKSDRCVLTVGHLERRPEPTVVVDKQMSWQGSRDRPVDLTEVEATILEAVRHYPGKLIFDPYQAAHMTQRLRRRGLSVKEFTFSSQSVGRLALVLYRLLRDAQLDLDGDDDGLLDELARVQLRETAPGAYRIDHASGQHDDRVVSLALVAQHLIGKFAPAPARVSSSAHRPLPKLSAGRAPGDASFSGMTGRGQVSPRPMPRRSRQAWIARQQGIDPRRLAPGSYRPPEAK